MSELVVIAYDEITRADEVLMTLGRLQKEHLIDLEDAAVVRREADGKISVRQAVDLVVGGATSGGLWGLLLGTLFAMPVFGAALGMASGAASGALSDIGIDDGLINELAQRLTPGSSAIFVLVRKATPDKVVDEIKPYGGTVLRSSLTKETEAELQAALSSAA